MGMSLYIGWASTAFFLAWKGVPQFPAQQLLLTLHALIPLPVTVFAFLALMRPRRRRLALSLAGVSSLALVLPMMTFSAYWWAGTGLLLLLVAVVPAIVFFYEAHGVWLFGENPFLPK